MKALQEDREIIDLEARVGLLGSAREKENAIVLLLDTYGKPIMAYLAGRFSSLDAEDRRSAVHDALQAVYDAAEEIGKDERPLASFLFTVARRSAIDLLRSNAKHVQPDDDLTAAISEALLGTEAGVNWNRLRVLDRAEAVQVEFREFVGTLKGQQKRVASVVADNMPDSLSDSEIAAEAVARSGEPMTTMEVKGAKAALMKKFRELMITKLRQP